MVTLTKFQHADFQVPDIQSVSLVSAILVKAVKAYYLLGQPPGISHCVMATCTGAAM
jgi:hypothetical protein